MLTVHNTGDQIPADQIPHIFERFYRVDSSRTRAQGGYGLGLSIAQSIVQAHHGKSMRKATHRAPLSPWLFQCVHSER